MLKSSRSNHWAGWVLGALCFSVTVGPGCDDNNDNGGDADITSDSDTETLDPAGCYDMSSHSCDCDTDEASCPGIWTDQCECDADPSIELDQPGALFAVPAQVYGAEFSTSTSYVRSCWFPTATTRKPLPTRWPTEKLYPGSKFRAQPITWFKPASGPMALAPPGPSAWLTWTTGVWPPRGSPIVSALASQRQSACDTAAVQARWSSETPCGTPPGLDNQPAKRSDQRGGS